MVFFLAFAALALLVAVVWTGIEVARDGYGRRSALPPDGPPRIDRA